MRRRGITLVALVVTVIILLIIAGIIVTLTIGEQGILIKAQNAGKNYVIAEEQESKTLENLYSSMLIATNDDSTITISIEDLNKIIDDRVNANNVTSSTTLYPNGAQEQPPTISTNQRIEIDNPYPGHKVYVRVEVYVNGMWGEPGFEFLRDYGSHGVKACQCFTSTGDKLVVQSGDRNVTTAAVYCGNPFGNDGDVAEAPYRLVVVCLD